MDGNWNFDIPRLKFKTITNKRNDTKGNPITKTDLDRIRGVNCALILRNLLLHGLIEAKVDKKKDETYYTVTLDFVRFLGIKDIAELPDYVRLSVDDSLDRMIETEEVIPL